MAFMFPWVRHRREALRGTPLPATWREVIERNVPLAAALPEAERRILDGLVQLFLYDKTFEGCGGLEMTDRIRVTIAAQACLLLLRLDVDVPYPELDVIRVYPSAYHGPVVERLGTVVLHADSSRLGESSRRGYIVLAWDAVHRASQEAHGPHNVTLHEFAHQLDTADGVADGAPVLAGRERYAPWARVLGAAFEDLQRDVAEHRHSVLDAYGATNPAEFFAVATEAFFEAPRRLRAEEPDLYATLASYYRQDPAAWAGT